MSIDTSATKPASNAEPPACAQKTDPSAPAGTSGSLGSKSDCNGRPSTDDSVVEAIDEQGPALNSRTERPRR